MLGSEELLPLSLKQIALTTGVSESTVSRIVRFKYLQLPNRNIPLSSLLEKKVTIRSSGGKEISPIQLTKLIIKIIETEKKFEPLSDQKIKEYLQKNNYKSSQFFSKNKNDVDKLHSIIEKMGKLSPECAGRDIESFYLN